MALVLRTVNDQLSVWDAIILPPELLTFPAELARVDARWMIRRSPRRSCRVSIKPCSNMMESTS